ncbi:odorant receptor 22c-like [Vespula maculifrons]|uniref:Odorant receptor 22c-like n=1 Tax=Vespula maculifrons TaxID=7453 RepID=A0ABD2CXB7_VESMC
MIGSYSMFTTYVQHACGMFSLAGNALEQILNELELTENKCKSVTNIHENIVRGIKYHNKAMQFTQTINNIYSYCYIVQVITVICLMAVEFTRIHDTMVLATTKMTTNVDDDDDEEFKTIVLDNRQDDKIRPVLHSSPVMQQHTNCSGTIYKGKGGLRWSKVRIGVRRVKKQIETRLVSRDIRGIPERIVDTIRRDASAFS